jgi:hypothetical protein
MPKNKKLLVFVFFSLFSPNYNLFIFVIHQDISYFPSKMFYLNSILIVLGYEIDCVGQGRKPNTSSYIASMVSGSAQSITNGSERCSTK